jgi:predicted metal-dependent peptidase
MYYWYLNDQGILTMLLPGVRHVSSLPESSAMGILDAVAVAVASAGFCTTSVLSSSEATPEAAAFCPVGIESPDGPVITDSETDIEKSWREDVQRAKERSPGGIGIALKTLLDEMFAKPVVDWKILLKKFANKISSKTEYFMPNKRFLGGGDVLWGSKRKKEGFETLFLVADTSGSIGKNELESFVGQTINIMKEFKPKETYLIWCDTKVYEPVDILKGPNDFWKMREAKGTGGGDFRPPFIWIEKNM